MNGRKNAFTLIELLVVISIIALLLAILMPALGKVKEAAKLTICSTNQHQLLLGVNTYAASNDDTYPTKVGNSWPNYLNYHSGTSTRSNNAMHIFLGDYLPEVNVFSCTLGPGQSDNMQQQYVDYRNATLIPEGTLVSYNMFWGGYTFGPTPGSMSEKIFTGPKKGSDKAAKLLVSDVMSWHLDGRWALSHKSKSDGGYVLEFDSFGNDWSNFWSLESVTNTETGRQEFPKSYKAKLNGGYVDGHVERYSSDDVDVFEGICDFYLPLKWDE